MKTRLGLFLVALSASLLSIAQTHITVDNPATWSGEVLRPYIGQTVVFDVPMLVSANANGNYIVSPWRRFQPETHGSVGTADYKETVRINNSCMFSIDNISGYHRCGEKIIGLQAKVNSTNSLTWVKGTWSGNTRADLTAGLPDLGDYRLLVCGFNLENYYLTWGSMGARNATEHRERKRKQGHATIRRFHLQIPSDMARPTVPRDETGVTDTTSSSPFGSSATGSSSFVTPPWGACAAFTLQPKAKTYFSGLDGLSADTATAYANARQSGLPSAAGMDSLII